ncbi:MAG: cupin, partial [Hyphomonadaceae bacterium]
MRIILFRDSKEAFEPWQPEPDRVVVAGATGGTQNLYESGDSRVFAGVWHATRGSWRVVYDEVE